MQKYEGDRIGLVLAFWAVALALGRVQVSQTDYTEDGTTFGSVLNHVTVGRKTNGAHPWDHHPVNVSVFYVSLVFSQQVDVY